MELGVEKIFNFLVHDASKPKTENKKLMEVVLVVYSL